MCHVHVYRRQGGCLSYFRDLALHSLFSARAVTGVWTLDELERPALKRQRVFADARSLVSELEVEILKRHRMLDEEGLKDWESHQAECPDDPLPHIVGCLLVVLICCEIALRQLRLRVKSLAPRGWGQSSSR